MTCRLKIFISASLLIGLAGAVSLMWSFGFHAERFKVKKAHKKLATAFREADSIIIKRLSSEVDDSDEIVSTWSHPHPHAVVSTHKLTGPEARNLTRQFSRQIYDKNGTACHYPGFHLELLDGAKRLVEFTLCFECMNLDMEIPWIGPQYVGFVSKDFLKDDNPLLITLLAITEG